MPERQASVIRMMWYTIWIAHIFGIVFLWQYYRFSSDAVTPVVLIAVGGLLGLLAMFFFLVQLFLISGVKPLEKPFGYDRLMRMHHVNGYIGWVLLLGHAPLILMGYTALSGNSYIEQLLLMVGAMPFLIGAIVSVILVNVVVVSSVIIVRRRLRYEWWRAVHFMAYGVIIFALSHQLAYGQVLNSSTWLWWYWMLLFIGAIGSVIFGRYIYPLILYRRHRFSVSKVVNETPNVTSVYVDGRGLETFKYCAGQFCFWYFWQDHFKTQRHPFTLSSSPGDPYLRFSAKAVGDFTSTLSNIKIGTPVVVTGPYGRFSNVVRKQKKRLFIAGGIGITPIRSILGNGIEAGDTLLYAVKTDDEIVFADEFKRWSSDGLLIEYYIEDGLSHLSSSKRISAEVLDGVSGLAKRDIWLCGPPPMMIAIERALVAKGVSKDSIFTERFST